MNTARSRLAIGAGLAALILCSATVGAGAAGLIGSRDIADNSIRGVDIKNGTVSGTDVKDGSLSDRDIAGGVAGPVRVVRWSGTHGANGSAGGETPMATSVDTVPPNSLVRGIDISVSGDHSTCTNAFLVALQPGNASAASRAVAVESFHTPLGGGETTHEVDMNDIITGPDSATPMKITAACASEGGDIAVPTFDFTVTFSITPLAAPSPETFE